MSSSIDEQILRASKEIVVKFIETGRISPSGFHEIFKTIYCAIKETVNGREKVKTGKDK
ncbi:MAG: hypothetical protein L6247_05530 [Desulfobacteraceae bacterium]|nr:hypothetical protein [Desulfobacteraceae bacterium]